MPRPNLSRQRGLIAILAALILFAAFGTLVLGELYAHALAAQRDRVTERALAAAREALIAYAVDRPIDASVGPGYLPCPDLDNDGWAESTCGSQSGDIGQAERLGRLPWKTLGIADLRDGDGERLWYAVSSKYKGLLNCAVSRACLDMTPDAALGTITVRDSSGTLIHDGTSTDLFAADRAGAVAVVIAPGAPLRRVEASGESREQVRGCAGGECDGSGRCITDPPWRAARCDPANYLDRASGARYVEDNANFIDRNDAAGRARNADGFIHGPVLASNGTLVVNDRLSVIGYADVMPRIMKRVALEVANCLRFYASRPENGGRYPWPAPACRQGLLDPALAWADAEGVLFGRIPDTPFTRTRGASGQRMLERWWRNEARIPENLMELPTRDNACRIAFEPAEEGTQRKLAPGSPADEGRTAGLKENAWWNSWKPFVFYAVARAYMPGATEPRCGECLQALGDEDRVVVRDRAFAVIVSGAPLPPQTHATGAIGDARQWLETPHVELERANPNPSAPQCTPDPARPPCLDCLRVSLAARGPRSNDVVVVGP